ncbi:MAG TPA: DsbA family protein, partial [Alphaproteobacteria bacterium]
MRIDIVADAVCPWCFIGKRRLERALAERPQRNVEIVWRPFFLNPDMPSEGMDRKEYLVRKFGPGRSGG